MAASPNIMTSNNPAVLDGGEFGTQILGNGITIDPSPGETTFVGTTTFDAIAVDGVDVNGNLTFTGTGRRIRGDMSNATLVDRLYAQTSTTNGSTTLGIIPNGTSQVAVLSVENNSTPTNCSSLSLLTTGSEVQLRTSIRGTGTILPLRVKTAVPGSASHYGAVNIYPPASATDSPGVTIGYDGNLPGASTDGFLYLPTVTNTPTGTPVNYFNKVPIVASQTNDKLYFYSGGIWNHAWTNYSESLTTSNTDGSTCVDIIAGDSGDPDTNGGSIKLWNKDGGTVAVSINATTPWDPMYSGVAGGMIEGFTTAGTAAWALYAGDGDGAATAGNGQLTLWEQSGTYQAANLQNNGLQLAGIDRTDPYVPILTNADLMLSGGTEFQGATATFMGKDQYGVLNISGNNSGADGGTVTIDVSPGPAAPTGTTHLNINSAKGNITLSTGDGNVSVNANQMVMPTFTVSTLPTGAAGGMIFVSDATPAPSMCFFNGTNWIDLLTGVTVI